jgi:hypothetical protein
MIISDICHKYTFKKETKSSGVIFSLIVVNQAISEKNIVIFFLSQSSFTAHVEFKISRAISLETYSDKALLKSLLFLSSFKYFNILEAKNDKNKINKN